MFAESLCKSRDVAAKKRGAAKSKSKQRLSVVDINHVDLWASAVSEAFWDVTGGFNSKHLGLSCTLLAVCLRFSNEAPFSVDVHGSWVFWKKKKLRLLRLPDTKYLGTLKCWLLGLAKLSIYQHSKAESNHSRILYTRRSTYALKWWVNVNKEKWYFKLGLAVKYVYSFNLKNTFLIYFDFYKRQKLFPGVKYVQSHIYWQELPHFTIQIRAWWNKWQKINCGVIQLERKRLI